MVYRVKLEETDTGEVFVPIPEEMLAEVGIKEGDLVDIVPMQRIIDGQVVETMLHVRRVRM
jgi:hypothetical protein